MKKSTRALIGLVVIDAAPIAGAAYMMAQVSSGAWATSVPKAEAIETIASVMGGAVGVVTVILGLVFVVQRTGELSGA